jgi:hypothetical protein
LRSHEPDKFPHLAQFKAVNLPSAESFNMKIMRIVAIVGMFAIVAGDWSSAKGFFQPAAAPAAKEPNASAPAAEAIKAPPPQSGSTASGSCCTPPAPRMVEYSVLVPHMVMEKRLMPCVEYTTEPRVKTFTVMHAVPETKTITRQCTVMVPETRTRMENYTVCKPVPGSSDGCCGGCKYEQETKQREVQYTVCVPQKKQYTCEVTVCKYVPEEKTVTFDACVSHIVQKPVEVPVCHMVSKKVLMPAPTCCPTPCCGGSCGGCGW